MTPRTTQSESHFEVDRFNNALSRMRNGDHSATQRFFECYVPFIRGVVCRLHYMVRSTEVDDIVQDTLFALLATKQSCRLNVKGWLYRFAYWQVRNCNSRDYALKRGGANNTVRIESMDRCLSHESEPSRIVSLREEVELIYDQVSDLDKQILTLLKLGSSRSELALHLGVSERTIRRHLASLRDIFANLVA